MPGTVSCDDNNAGHIGILLGHPRHDSGYGPKVVELLTLGALVAGLVLGLGWLVLCVRVSDDPHNLCTLCSMTLCNELRMKNEQSRCCSLMVTID